MNESTPSSVAERYVIGALLADPRVLRSVQEACVPSDFEDLRLGDIYKGISQMAVDSVSIDYLTVWDRLKTWDVRGIELPELAQWAQDVPSAANAHWYADIVRESALTRSLLDEATKLRTEATQSPGVAVSAAIERLKILRDRDAVGVSNVTTLRDVLSVPESEDAYDWIVPGILERKDRLMLTGQEGGGKSTLLRQIAVLTAAGVHPFEFRQIEPVRVLVVDAENSERQWRRAVRPVAEQATRLGVRDPGYAIALEFLARVDLASATVLGGVHRLIDAHRPDLILIGPLYRLVKGSINSDEDAAPVLSALDSIRDRGVAMLIEAHAGHAVGAGGERDLRPRGSSALLGWPEFGLGLRRDRGDQVPGRTRFELVRWRGDRDAREWPGHLTRHPSQRFPWEPTYA